MRIGALAATAPLLMGAAPLHELTQRDFRQLMEVAIAASTTNAPRAAGPICVRRELDPPLRISRPAGARVPPGALPGVSGTTGPRPEPTGAQRAIGAAFATALGPDAIVDSQRLIPAIPGNYDVFSKKARVPSGCIARPIPPPGGSGHERLVTRLIFSRPVLANGYAFVDQLTECSGLCGSGWLRVFKKQNGKWTQVEYRNLFMS